MSFKSEALAASRLAWAEATEVMMNPGHLQHGFTRLRQMFVVLAQTAIAPQPSQRPFHHPTAPQRDEAALPGGTADDPDPVGPMMHPQPAVQLRAVILVVGLHHLQAG